jgi:hypothetical protein
MNNLLLSLKTAGGSKQYEHISVFASNKFTRNKLIAKSKNKIWTNKTNKPYANMSF